MPFEVFGTTAAGGAVTSLTRGVKTAAAAAGAPSANAFAESLGKLVDNVEQTAEDANVAVTNMVDKSGDVHEAMIALQRAEMTLELTVQVRNKLVQAYQDVMRMPI
jgi:flagellar hook-basal body complex protein FliE